MSTKISKIQWLVEIRGERLGPFTTHQIIERVMRKEIKVVHRVSETGEGWVAICNEPIFEQHVESLIESVSDHIANGSAKKGMESDDATVVSQDLGELSGIHNIDAKSLGITDQLSHAKELQMASTNLSLLREILAEMRIRRKVIITPQKSTLAKDEDLHPDDQDEYVEAPMTVSDYITSGTSKFLFTILTLAGILFGGLEVKDYLARQEIEKERLAQQEQELRSKYGKSVTGNAGQSIAALSESELLSMADQELGVGQASPVKWTLMESAQKQGQLVPVAQEEKAIDQKKHQELSTALNKKAYEFLLSGDLNKAEQFLLKSLQLSASDKTPTILLLFETALLFHQADSGSSSNIRIQEVRRLARQYRLSMGDKFNTKLLIAEIALSLVQNESPVQNKLVQEFVNRHPRNEKEGPSVGVQFKVSWGGLLPHCVRIYNVDRSDSQLSALLAGCLVRTEQADKAEPYIYYAFKKEPTSQPIRDLLAFTYLATGKIDLARQNLWDPKVPSFQVTPYQSTTRIEFCRMHPEDTACRGRGTASSP